MNIISRTGEQANFLVAQAPDFFPSGFCFWYLISSGSGYWLSLAKYSFPRKVVRKTAKNIKQVK